MKTSNRLRLIRIWISIVILGLFVSGVTAFPLEYETAWLAQVLLAHPVLPPDIIVWVNNVSHALIEQSIHAPFLAYGTDWLAFAHLVLALAFVGPLIDPVRNKWVVQFGLIACVGVLALALIAGPLRGIPLLWRFIDCSFGVFGVIPRIIALRQIESIEGLVSSTRDF